jgi:hypothetical protein
VENSLRVKKFIGKAVKGLAKNLHSIIDKAASAKNLYTHEISSSSSKAAKIVLGNDSILFEDEEAAMIEVLIYLLQTKDSPRVYLMKKTKALPLDPFYDSDYIQFLLKERTDSSSSIMDGIEAEYGELSDPKERAEIINMIKNPEIDFGMEENWLNRKICYFNMKLRKFFKKN